MLASKRQVNLVDKSRKVFQFLPLHFIAESAIKYLATLLVREFGCFFFVGGGFGAVLSVETPGISRTVDKEFVMVKLTSFSDVHQKLLSWVAVGKKRAECIASAKSVATLADCSQLLLRLPGPLEQLHAREDCDAIEIEKWYWVRGFTFLCLTDQVSNMTVRAI